jgi:hypothetical protein
MEEKLDIILESLERIENRLRRLECHCKDNEPNFMREVGANVLGDYIYTILDEHWIRRRK